MFFDYCAYLFDNINAILLIYHVRKSCISYSHFLFVCCASSTQDVWLVTPPPHNNPSKGEFNSNRSANITHSRRQFDSGNIHIIQLSSSVTLDPRPEYHRVNLKWHHGYHVPTATSTGGQCSSRMLSMRSANALLVLPPKSDEQTVLPIGTIVQAMLVATL